MAQLDNISYQYPSQPTEILGGCGVSRHGRGPFKWRRVAMNRVNVGELLSGVPPALIDSIAIDDVWEPILHLPRWYHLLGPKIRYDRASARREALIADLAGQVSWTDHGRCWSLGGRVIALEGRPYYIDARDLAQIDLVCRTWDLASHIGGSSSYGFGTLRVLIFRQDVALGGRIGGDQ